MSGSAWTTSLSSACGARSKYEAVYLQDIADGFAAKRITDDWMHFHNRERLHSALGKATPDEAYGEGTELKKAA